jgi:hypothetical protein
MMTRVYSRNAGSSSSRSSSCGGRRRQPRGAAQTAQGIFDLVRELSDHQAAAAQLRQQRVFSGESPVLRDVFYFEQQEIFSAEGYLRDRAIEDPIDASGRRPRELALHHALAAVTRALEQR